MLFCGICGTKIEDGTKFCSACGTPVAGADRQAVPPYTEPAVSGTPEAECIKDVRDNKVMAVLAYIIFLIPLLAAKESKFVRFHTNQGLVLFLTSVALRIIYGMLIAVLTAVSWRLGLAAGGTLWLLLVVPFILAIIGIHNACKGAEKPLPVIGAITLLK